MRHLLALAAVKPPELIDQPYWSANEFVNKPWLGAKLMCFGDVNPVTWVYRCLMVHKCLNSNVPEYLCNHFTRSDHKHSTRTSTSGSVNIPALRTVQGQRSFGYTGSKEF